MKIVNKMYSMFLNLFPSVKIQGIIDYRVEIKNKKNIRIGEKSIIYKNVTIYKKNNLFSIGKNSHIAPYCYFLLENQRLYIGDNVAIGPYCCFFCVSNYYGKIFTNNYEKGDIMIGNNVFIGAHTIILPGSKIEDNTIIGANSVVRGTLKSGYLYAGSLAKPIKRIV